MRPIKFRGKDKQGQWVYGNLLQWPNGDCEICVAKGETDMDKISVDPKTIGQFTGMYDAYNKPIYEGDIVEGCREDADDSTLGEVEFYNGSFMVNERGDFYLITDYIDGIEVIETKKYREHL